MKVRSPVLGYNHNVRYAGRLWHVQTEDSGVQNPHLFTHLFHDGTILATKRLDYDAAAEVSAVQKLMQTQHKAMLRELKSGSFDEKIGKFFGEPVQRVPEDETTDPNARPPLEETVDAQPAQDIELPDFEIATPVRPSPAPPPVARPNATAAQAVPRTGTHHEVTQPRMATPPRTVAPAASALQPKPVPPTVPRAPGGAVGGLGARRAASNPGQPARPAAEGVLVARPAVIIGAEGNGPRTPTLERKTVSGTRWNQPSSTTLTPPPASEPKNTTNDNIFGGDLISEKSLDEVILAYLSEDLNEK